METKIILPEDVIEQSLQQGVKSAMERFGLSETEVISIVKPFTDEIDKGVKELCPCEINRRSICFMCENHNKLRPRIGIS